MNVYAIWFRRVVWLGVLVNLLVAIPALFNPNQVLGLIGLPLAQDVVWPRFAALLLILLSLFYIPASINPFRQRHAAWLSVFARVVGVLFFVGFFPTYAIFGLLDLTFAIPEGILLTLAYKFGVPRDGERETSQEARARAARDRRINQVIGTIIGLAIALIVSAIGLGWYHLFRQVPVTYADPDVYYKYGSVGTETEAGLPYWLWLVLPEVFPEHLPGGYAALGFIDEGPQAQRPSHADQQQYDTPIGFSVKTVGFPRVNFNCAVCHTGTYRTTEADTPKAVLGMPANRLDAQKYLQFLFACAGDPRFNADTLLAAMEKHTKLSDLERVLYRYVIIPRTKQGILQQNYVYSFFEQQVGNPPRDRPLWGRGRIDPFNGVKYGLLGQPFDETIGNADMVPLWEMTPGDGPAFHWDGLNTSLTEVVRSSALGDGATERSIPLNDLKSLQDYLIKLEAPAFPYPPGRPRNDQLWNRGQQIYAREGCNSCHDPDGARFRQVVPVEEVGTDRHRLDMWTKAAATDYNGYVENPSWRFKAFQKTNGYVSMPLDGLWLRAPYLHNGSVPTLRDLLNDPKDRPKVFFRGYDVIDFDNIGFIANGPQASTTGTRFDTSEPGNGNQGHLYGTQLPAEEKEALLEYLKSR